MCPWHLAFASDGRHPSFATAAQLRSAVRGLARIAGPRVLLFGIAGHQAQLVLDCHRSQAGQLARTILAGLRARGARSLEPARLRPVQDSEHLAWLLEQVLHLPWRQGQAGHPALWEGSCLPELLGARRLPRLSPGLASHLPGYSPLQAAQAVGLQRPPARLPPATARGLGIQRVVSAAAVVMAAPPAMTGREMPVVLARRCAARVAALAGIPRSELAWALGLSGRSAYRLASASLPPGSAEALLMRLALEEAVAAQSAYAAPPPGGWSAHAR